jgi:glycosyltransferase involved in cell wall biosynthesis
MGRHGGRPRLLFLISEDWYFWSHRLDLARAARNAGCEVLLATRFHEHRALIEKEDIKTIAIGMRRSGAAPLHELATLAELIGIYRRERPDIVHHVAMKPVLYGSWAARLTGVPAVVNAFAGLGYLFINQSWRARTRRSLVSLALRSALSLPNARVILQNREDLACCIDNGLLRAEQVTLVRGSGVDTHCFMPPATEASLAEPPLVVLAARMLWDKGIGEFVHAAKMLKQQGVRARFALVGRLDTENPAAISEPQLRQWQAEGAIEWWDHRDDMADVLKSAQVVVLPSYREGLPKVLLEAAACARAIVATDVPGCRDVVRDGDNGLLVPAKDGDALAAALARLLADADLRARLGARGRQIVAQEFSIDRIARETLTLYQGLLDRTSLHGVRAPIKVPDWA